MGCGPRIVAGSARNRHPLPPLPSMPRLPDPVDRGCPVRPCSEAGSEAGRGGQREPRPHQETTMIKGLSAASVWSADLKNLLPFYRDVLGLKVVIESPRFVVLGEAGGGRPRAGGGQGRRG